MSEPVLQVVATTRMAAHAAAMSAYELSREMLAGGKKVLISVQEAPTAWDLRQLKFYWGQVLKHTSEQVRIGGRLYSAQVWHKHFKETFLSFEFVPVNGEIERRLRSTTSMPAGERQAYIEMVVAYAVNDLGVNFPLDQDDLPGAPLRFTPVTKLRGRR